MLGWPPILVALAIDDSRGRGCVWHGYSPDENSMPDLCFPRVSCSPVQMCAVELNFPRASFPPGELCAERLYKTGFTDGIASVYANRAWVTPLRISPQTCTGLFLFDVVSSSVN